MIRSGSTVHIKEFRRLGTSLSMAQAEKDWFRVDKIREYNICIYLSCLKSQAFKADQLRVDEVREYTVGTHG